MEKTERAQVQAEYATQHFGFSPSSFLDEITEDSLELVGGALGAMKQQVERKLPGKVNQEILDQCFTSLGSRYSETAEKLFDKLGSYLCSNILVVPGQVLLPEDEAWDGVGAKTDVSAKLAAVNNDMAAIRNKIKTALYKKTVLANELENIRSVCSRQEAAIQQQVSLIGNPMENLF